MAKLQGKVKRSLPIQDAEPRRAEPIPSFIGKAVLVLSQLEYRRTEAESMIAETRAEAS